MEQPPQPADPMPAPARRRRRWLRWPLRILGGLLLLLVIAYLGRRWLVMPFVADFAAQAAGEALGGELSIEEIGGSLFGSVEIRGIRTERPGTTTPLRSLELDELVAEYSLWQLATGEPDWFHAVRGHGLRVGVDLRQGAPAVAEPEAEEQAAAFEAPPWLPAVELSGVAVVLDGEQLHLEAPSASLQAALQSPGRHRLVFEAVVQELEAQDQRLDDARLRVVADWTAGALELPHLDAELVHGEERLTATGRIDPERLHATVIGSKLQLAPYAAAAGQELALELGLQAELELPLADPAGARAEVELEGLAFAGFGFELERLSSRITVVDGHLNDGSLELVAPEGTVKLSRISLPLDPGLPLAELARQTQLDLELRLPQLPALLARRGIELEGLPAVTERLTLVGGKRDGELAFEQAGLSGSAGGLSLSGLRLQVGGEADMLTASGIHLPLEFQLEQPWTAADGVELPPIDGKLTVAVLTPVNADGVPEMARIALEDLELRAEDGSVRLSEEARVELNLRQDLKVENLVLETPAGTLELEVDLPLQVGAEELLGDGPLVARGSLSGFELARLRPLLGEIELPVTAGRADLSFALEGSWEEPVMTLAAEGEEWRLAPLAEGLPTGPFAFALSAAYTPGRAELGRGTLTGAGLSAAWQGEMALPLDLRALAAGAAPDLSGALQAEASLESAELGWLAALAPELKPAARSARAAVALEGTIDAPVLTADFRAQALTAGAEAGPPLDLALRARHAGDRLELQELTAAAEGLALSATGSLPLAADPAAPLAEGPVELRLELSRLELPAARALATSFGGQELPEAAGSLRAGLRLAGDWSALELDGELHGEQLVVALPDSELPMEPATLDARFGWADGSAKLSQLQLRSALAELDADAAMALAGDLRALLDGGGFELGPIAGRAEARIPDLAWTAALPSIVRAEGAAVARLGFSGTTDALDYGGEIELEDATLRLASPGLAAFTALNLHGRFDQETVTIERLDGELGAEPFEASGSVRYAGVAEPELDLSFSGRDLLLFRAQGVKLRANANLEVSGPLSQAVAKGRVKVTDGRLVKKVDFLRVPIGAPAPPSPGGIQLFSLAPPLDQLAFDVQVTSTEGFFLRNNVARGRLRPELQLTGTGAVPVLLGEVYLDDLVMDLPATRLEMQPSVVRFLPNDPFRPRINLRGGMRRYGYDVEMLVTGPFDQAEVLFSSVPPLTQEELLLFVSTGQPPAERVDAEGAMSSVAIYLAKDFLATFFGDESTEAEESVLDRREIYTGRDTTRQGEETIEGRFRMIDQFLFDDDSLYLESEKDSYGDFNIGLKLLIRYP